MADRVRFIQCTVNEFESTTKDNNALYFIKDGDLKGALYKGEMLVGKDFTEELTGLVDIVEQLMNTQFQGLQWKEF